MGAMETRLLLLLVLVAVPLAGVSAYAFADRRASDAAAIRADTGNLSRILADTETLTVASARQLLVGISGYATNGGWSPTEPPSAACSAYAAGLLKQATLYTNIGIATRAGDITCSAVPLTVPVNVADRAYFQRVLQTRAFAVGDFVQGRATGLYTVTTAYPILDGTGQPIGVIFAALDLSTLAGLFQSVSVPAGSEAMLLDSQGTVVARFPEDNAVVGKPWADAQSMTARLAGGSANAEIPGADGVRRMYSLRALALGGGASSLYVAVGVPPAAAYAPANRALVRSLLALAAIFMIAMLFARLFARRSLVRPIERLLATAGDIGAGNLQARAGPPYPGTELGALGRGIDLMASALAEQDRRLRDSNAQLERRVQERTAELTALSAQERLAREEADRANHAKSDFLSQMSHELRTPLNAVLGFADLLGERAHDRLVPRELQYIEHIHGAGEHLLGLINDVLDLARVEAGKTQLFIETLHLEQLLEPVIAATRLAADQRHVRFTVDAGPNVALSLDPGRVRQILLNLLSNAVKFTPDGGDVRLLVEAHGPVLTFEVADTGIGIPAARQDRVFGVFERLHEDLAQIGGTGVGLALTKQLVELQQGEISFTSVEGEGTTFRVRIPNVVRGRTVGRRLLIVEDEASSAELVAERAAEVGLECQVVNSVGEALEATRAAPPTGAIVDLRLRGERGEELLRALKSDPATMHIPVLVLSIEDDTGRSRSLGAEDHLTKPVDVRRLSAWLHRIAANPEG